MTIPRHRVAWGLQERAGGLQRFLAGEQLWPNLETPPDCLAVWPALMFRTRQAARAFVRARYAEHRPRIVRARAVVEECVRHKEATP
jgi:hypothetical protein